MRYYLLALDDHENEATIADVRDALYMGTPFGHSEIALADVTPELEVAGTTALHEMKRRLT